MRLPIGLFVAVAAAIVGVWWWLGAPVGMAVNPLGLNEKLHCISYAPFRGPQSPFDPTALIDPRQIDEDLARLAKLTACIRTYSARNGLDRVPEVAARHGLTVMQGIWLGGDAQMAERDMSTAVALAKRYPQTVQSLVVGNEVLLRGEMTGLDLAAAIRRVKAQVSVPVTYADVWEFWLRHREIYDAVDFVTIHILPYWEDFPIPARDAAAHIAAIRAKVAAAFPGKEILLGETGWPSAGRMREGALPSPANQARVLHEVLAQAKRENFRVNLIEAFDQPWKRWLEGTVGGHWGLLDGTTREPKFQWGGLVSNHPNWQMQAAGGLALAAFVFGAAAAARRPNTELPLGTWLGVAVIAAGAGGLIGWTVENLLLESLGAGGWLRSLVMAGLAIAAPLAGAAGMARRTAAAGFARVLGPKAERPTEPLAFALGGILVLLCVIALQTALGLAFDPRYRDFPFAPLTAATLPFLIVAPFGARHGGGRVAEGMAAAVLAVCAAYIVLNEGFANWQALWLAGVLVALVVILVRLRGGRD